MSTYIFPFSFGAYCNLTYFIYLICFDDRLMTINLTGLAPSFLPLGCPFLPFVFWNILIIFSFPFFLLFPNKDWVPSEKGIGKEKGRYASSFFQLCAPLIMVTVINTERRKNSSRCVSLRPVDKSQCHCCWCWREGWFAPDVVVGALERKQMRQMHF